MAPLVDREVQLLPQLPRLLLAHVREHRILDLLVQLADARTPGQVVHPERGAQGAGDLRVDQPVAGQDRDEERQHAYEVGRVAQGPLTLVQGVVHESDVALLQVSEAAVDELGRLRRRPAREVVALDERDPQAPRGGVERDPAAGDPAADDEEVELLGLQAGERGGTVYQRGFPDRVAMAQTEFTRSTDPATDAAPMMIGVA